MTKFTITAKLKNDKRLEFVDVPTQNQGENGTAIFKITVPQQFADNNFHLEFACPRNKRYCTGKLDSVTNANGDIVLTYGADGILYADEGLVLVQLVARNKQDSSVVFKSTKSIRSSFYVNRAINATERTRAADDFYLQLQAALKKADDAVDEMEELTDAVATALNNGEFKGEKGEKGDNGAGIASISAVQTVLDGGNKYTMYPVDTNGNALASFEIFAPKGDKGEIGAQGEKGEKGETGAKGEKGDKGEDGTGLADATLFYALRDCSAVKVRDEGIYAAGSFGVAIGQRSFNVPMTLFLPISAKDGVKITAGEKATFELSAEPCGGKGTVVITETGKQPKLKLLDVYGTVYEYDATSEKNTFDNISAIQIDGGKLTVNKGAVKSFTTSQLLCGGQSTRNTKAAKLFGINGDVEISASEYLPAEIISFNIAHLQYSAEKGMTWSEWADSDFNTDGIDVFDAEDGTLRLFISELDEYNYFSVYATEGEKPSAASVIVADDEYVINTAEPVGYFS